MSNRKLFLTVVCGAICLGACARAYDSNQPRRVSAPPASQDSSKESNRDSERKTNEQIRTEHQGMIRAVELKSRRFGIISLQRVNLLETQSEARVWTGFSNSGTNCLTLRFNQQQAVYLTENETGTGKLEMRNGFSFKRQILAPPISGWPGLISTLKSEGIEFPLPFKLDERHLPDPDEEYLVIEARKGTDYSLVFYSLLSEEKEAQRALGICQLLEREFQVRMWCTNGPN